MLQNFHLKTKRVVWILIVLPLSHRQERPQVTRLHLIAIYLQFHRVQSSSHQSLAVLSDPLKQLQVPIPLLFLQ